MCGCLVLGIFCINNHGICEEGWLYFFLSGIGCYTSVGSTPKCVRGRTCGAVSSGSPRQSEGPLLPGSADPGLSLVERDFDVRFSDI